MSDFDEDQRRAIREIALEVATEFFRHEMANLGFGTIGPPREETLKNNWYLNEERKRFESADFQADRKWTSETRIWWLTDDQQEIRRQQLEEHRRRKKWSEWRGSILTAVLGAVITAAMLGLFLKAPALIKVLWP